LSQAGAFRARLSRWVNIVDDMGHASHRRMIMFDVLAACGFALLPAVSVLPLGAGDQVTVTTMGLAFGAALPLAVRRIWPVPVFVVVLVAACLALPFGLAPTSFLAAAYASYLVAVTRRGQTGRSVAVVGGVSTAGAMALTVTGARQYEGGTRPVQVIFGVLVLGVAWAAGAAVRERRENTRRAIEQAAERAKTEERLRIARELHDVVTHSVGVIAVKAGVANHVIASHPEEAREALTVIEGVSRKALRDLRATLRALRQAGDHPGDPRPVLVFWSTRHPGWR
jgi:signal transduction histidine kinase